MNIRTTNLQNYRTYASNNLSLTSSQTSSSQTDEPVDSMTFSDSKELTGLYRLGAGVAIGGAAIGIFQGNLPQIAGSLAAGVAIMVYAKN